MKLSGNLCGKKTAAPARRSGEVTVSRRLNPSGPVFSQKDPHKREFFKSSEKPIEKCGP